MKTQLNKYSSRITRPKSQGASQAMLYGTGLKEADMAKPQVGIATVCETSIVSSGRSTASLWAS